HPMHTIFPYTTLFRSLERDAQPFGQGFNLDDLGAQQNLFVTPTDSALERPNEVRVAARHELRSELHDAHLTAECVVNTGHLESEDRKSTRLNSSHVAI